MDTYDVQAGIVTLVHSNQSVQVDISLLVDDLQFNSGDWLHVIGYLESLKSKWTVEAIMAWPVSPNFNLIQYEDTVSSRMQTMP